LEVIKKNIYKLSKLNNTILSQNKELVSAFEIITESSKKKLLNLVVHDLRTPITSLSLMVELIQDEKDENERKEVMVFNKNYV
jgi:signal transduction histidine kinase